MSKISVIITTHSRPLLLPRAVESAFAAGSDVEVVVVDDASRDETAAVCSGLSGIKYIRLDKNHGTAKARNIGIEGSVGEYVSFHDDDDRKLPGSLNELIEILDANPKAGLAYGQAWAGNDELEPKGDPFPDVSYHGDVFWRLIEGNFIPTIAAVFRRSCLAEVGMIDPRIPGVDDYDLWIRIAERYHVLALEKPVGVWRESVSGSGQGSSDKVLEAVRTNLVSNRALKTLARAITDDRQREIVKAAVKRRTSEFLLWNASELLKEGQKSESRRSLMAGLRVDTKRAIQPGVLKLLARSFLTV